MFPEKKKDHSLIKPSQELDDALKQLCDVTTEVHGIVFMPTHMKMYKGLLTHVYKEYPLDEFISAAISIVISELSWLQKFNYLTMNRVLSRAAKLVVAKRSGASYLRYLDNLKESHYRLYELGVWNSWAFLKRFFNSGQVNIFYRDYPDIEDRKSWLLNQYDEIQQMFNMSYGANMDRMINQRIREYIKKEG